MAKSTRIATSIGTVADLPPILLTEDGKLTEQQVAFVTDTIRALIRAVNGRISFGDGIQSTQSGNVDGHTKRVTFASADTDYEVPHGLGRVPIGIVVLDVDTDDAIVRGASKANWSPTRMFVRCNVAGTVALFVVV